MYSVYGFVYGYDCEASWTYYDTQTTVILTFPWRMSKKVAPDASHWEIVINGTEIPVVAIEWLDDFSLKLKGDSYDFPDTCSVNHVSVGYDCKFKNGKQFEIFYGRVAKAAA